MKQKHRLPCKIEPTVMYSIETFCAMTKMDKSAIRLAKKRGLKVYQYGRQGYLLGREFIDFIQRQEKAK